MDYVVEYSLFVSVKEDVEDEDIFLVVIVL